MPAMLRLRTAWLALLAAAFAPQAAAVEFVQDTAALAPAQARRAHAVVDAIAARLPAPWRAGLPARVAIEWRDDLPADVHGRALAGRVLLARRLLDTAPASAIDPAAAALVHELAHVLDRGDRGGLSRDPRLLDLAGWQATLPRGRTARNVLRDRSPDPYEARSPREFVAVNLEYALLDPSYACRRPALARHFAARIGTPLDTQTCAPGVAYVQSDAADDAAPPLLELDPPRVAGIDLLLAEPGSAAMSRWGHVMLRVVVCAPGRAPGPACRLDLSHHRVLSFRAFVDNVQVSSWRGLAGSYPSRLFVLPLSQVVDEYTKVELRGLRSVPLVLAREEIDSVLEHASQLHWSYDGRYYFVTNNCAVETWRLLRDAVPRLASAPIASITPTGLLARLQRAGIADASALADREAATRSGAYFPSQASHYAALFDVARASLPLPVGDVGGWLALAPQARARWIGHGDLEASAALLVLENAALRREESRARDALERHAAGRARDARIDEVLGLADRLTRPAALLPRGYGLPQRDEREALRGEAAKLARAWREASTRLRAEARGMLPPARRAALDAAEANVQRLGARLRVLHASAGGLELDRGATQPHGGTAAGER